MPSLKTLRNRIASVRATQKITRAMQMVAASKLRRAQDAAEQARPYAEHMDAVLQRMAAQAPQSDALPPLLRGRGQAQSHLFLVATAARGLCGGFNAAIVRQARRHLQRLQTEGKAVKLLCIGRKGHESLRRQYASHMLEPIALSLAPPDFALAEQIAERVLDLYEEEAFEVCTIFYARFHSVMTQIPQAQQVIPLPLTPAGETPAAGGREEEASRSDKSPPPAGAPAAGALYEYEPDAETVLNALLPHNLAVQILRALLENAASEQGARMTAMDSATRNAGEMIDGLTIVYNRSRQAMITKELIEIISGAEAL